MKYGANTCMRNRNSQKYSDCSARRRFAKDCSRRRGCRHEAAWRGLRDIKEIGTCIYFWRIYNLKIISLTFSFTVLWDYVSIYVVDDGGVRHSPFSIWIKSEKAAWVFYQKCRFTPHDSAKYTLRNCIFCYFRNKKHQKKGLLAANCGVSEYMWCCHSLLLASSFATSWLARCCFLQYQPWLNSVYSAITHCTASI